MEKYTTDGQLLTKIDGNIKMENYKRFNETVVLNGLITNNKMTITMKIFENKKTKKLIVKQHDNFVPLLKIEEDGN